MKADFMSYGEQVISQYLKTHHIYYKYGVVPSWLNGLHLDFYVPSLKLGIEFDGYQHFFPVSFGNDDGDDDLINHYMMRCLYDKKKNVLCKRHGVNLLRIENYTQRNLNRNTVLKFISHGLHVASLLNNDNDFKNILYEPHRIRKFKVNMKAIKYALPVKNPKHRRQISNYIKRQKYGFIKKMLKNFLLVSFLHTRDVFKLTYDDVFNENGTVKNRFRAQYQSIGVIHDIVRIPPQLKGLLIKYNQYLNNNNLKSIWLFPNPHSPNRHVSFTYFSKFISKIARYLHLKHFNIYSLRKTGGYIVYKRGSLKIATLFLDESTKISTYDYLGYDGQKLMNKITEKIFSKY